MVHRSHSCLMRRIEMVADAGHGVLDGAASGGQHVTLSKGTFHLGRVDQARTRSR